MADTREARIGARAMTGGSSVLAGLVFSKHALWSPGVSGRGPSVGQQEGIRGWKLKYPRDEQVPKGRHREGPCGTLMPSSVLPWRSAAAYLHCP